jgi:hypothetical protein
MPLTQHCSNITYSQSFNTDYDFTVSFTYTMNTGGFNPVANNGFSVFFTDASQTLVNGQGGCGAGLGVASNTTPPNGLFCIVGFDITGNFFRVGGIAAFTNGTAVAIPNSVGVRTGTNYKYIGSNSTFTINPNLFGPLGPAPTPYAYQTVRVCVRKKFQQIDVYSLNNKDYVLLGSFNTGLNSVPANARFGISYSGDTLFEVSNITANFT